MTSKISFIHQVVNKLAISSFGELIKTRHHAYTYQDCNYDFKPKYIWYRLYIHDVVGQQGWKYNIAVVTIITICEPLITDMTDDFNIGLPAVFLLGEMYIYVPIILYMWFSARMSFICIQIYHRYFINNLCDVFHYVPTSMSQNITW